MPMFERRWSQTSTERHKAGSAPVALIAPQRKTPVGGLARLPWRGPWQLNPPRDCAGRSDSR